MVMGVNLPYTWTYSMFIEIFIMTLLYISPTKQGCIFFTFRSMRGNSFGIYTNNIDMSQI